MSNAPVYFPRRGSVGRDRRNDWGNLRMGLKYTLVLTTLLLAACAKSPAELEVADDADCRKIIAERHDTSPTAYNDCRAHLADYRRNRAIAASGSSYSSTTVVTR
jgi:hypothetical protein